MQAPLEGIRVIELASYVAVPAAGTLLADMGAEVIKVEVPQGEIYRYALPQFLGYQTEFAEAPQFHMDNRGKRSLTLDVNRPAARAALQRLIDGSDIVLTNMLPTRLEKFGLDHATQRAARPELIFASLNGFGTNGPEASSPAFDYIAYWARTGFMDVLHEPDAPPAFQRPGIGDHAAALALVAGILAALRMRDHTGVGQVVESNLMQTGFYIQGNDTSCALVSNQDPPRHDRRRPLNPLWNHYPTRDGRWLFLSMIDSNRYFPMLCDALGVTELTGDPRFSDMLSRLAHSEELTARLAEVFAQRTLAEWERDLAGRDLIWAPVRRLAEAIGDTQAAANEMFPVVDHPTLGSFRTVAPPVKLSGYELRVRRAGPALGAHSQEVLREAGLSEAEIAAALGSETTEAGTWKE